MLFGGPIDLTPFGALVRGAGLAYWVVAAALVGWVMWAAPRWQGKLFMGALVAALFIAPIAVQVHSAKKEQQVVTSKLDAAMALFQERCKASGEKIHRTIENVDGVVWMKWRDKELNYGYQFKLDDPYGRDCGGEECITLLLRATKGLEHDPQRKRRHYLGYRFVESIDPKDGQRYRYSMRLIEQDSKLQSFPEPVIEREPIGQYTARYGITWDDISTYGDRELWIAGGSLKIVDLQTNEVLAERVGYMMDQGQGSTAGFRQPWSFAQQHACPLFPRLGPTEPRRRRPSTVTIEFASRVLQPTME
jgi:hypothetical protein